MTVSKGDTVRYVISDEDAFAITWRRRSYPTQGTGMSVQAGNVVPIIVTNVWPGLEKEPAISGQAILDGDDSWWVGCCRYTKEGLDGTWHYPDD